MNIFFRTKYKYIVHDSYENVFSNFRSFSELKNPDITCKLGYGVEEDTFVFYQSTSIFISWLEKSPAYVIVKFSDKKDQTIINVTVRSNIFLVSLFYIMLFLLLNAIKNITNSNNLAMPLLYLFFGLVIYVFIRITTNNLKEIFFRNVKLQESKIYTKTQ